MTCRASRTANSSCIYILDVGRKKHWEKTISFIAYQLSTMYSELSSLLRSPLQGNKPAREENQKQTC